MPLSGEYNEVEYKACSFVPSRSARHNAIVRRRTMESGTRYVVLVYTSRPAGARQNRTSKHQKEETKAEPISLHTPTSIHRGSQLTTNNQQPNQDASSRFQSMEG